MSAPDWRLARRIRTFLAGADGQRLAELAEQLSATVADTQKAVWVLYRRREVDLCTGYIVLPARPAGEVRAA